jgi:hypothetical protein
MTAGNSGNAKGVVVMAANDLRTNKPLPSVAELQAQLQSIADALRAMHGERSAVIIAIGLPNGYHDRFAAYATGPCLMERGLLHWAVPKLEEQMDSHVTESTVSRKDTIREP